MDKYLIITAGGMGKRMGADMPKQFLDLAGRPIILHTIERFIEYDSKLKLIIVLPEAQIKIWEELCEKHTFTHEHKVVTGGNERFFSVRNGLKECKSDSLIAIHDAVRPLVSSGTIERCFTTAKLLGNAIPIVKTQESLREVHQKFNRPLNRDVIMFVQTPQVFSSALLLKAYDCAFSPGFTDDASVVERLGENINLVKGNLANIKITTPVDYILAMAMIKLEEY